MNIGMLWFDNNQQSALAEKVERAVAYYLKKYGAMPTLCLVHPTMLTNGTSGPSQADTLVETKDARTIQVAGVEIRPFRSVLPNHLWIGIGRKVEA